jgi:endonuclease/exonuclease/phosphatase (EEP) superfamily protein YafD
VRALIGVLVGIALLGSLVLTVLRFVEVLAVPVLAATSFSSYALVGYAAVLVVLLALLRGARRRRLAGTAATVAAVGLVAHAAWLAPDAVGGTRTRPDLTVMSSNLEFGQGDPGAVVAAVRDRDVDVLVLQEVTPELMAALEADGLTRLLPHVAGDPVPGVRGTLVLSHFELADRRPLELRNGGLSVRVLAPTPTRVYAVHTGMLLSSPDSWHRDLATVARAVRDRDRGEPAIFVGDYNATPDHLPYRRVLDAGVRDAAEEAGSGWQPTWPTRWRQPWLRPLVTIDHVLVPPGVSAVSTQTLEIPHTDHLALLARLRTAG